MHETTVKLFMEHEKCILEKNREDRQRRMEVQEHELRLFILLCSHLGNQGPCPLHPPGPPPLQSSKEFDEVGHTMAISLSSHHHNYSGISE